jgi:hypothetical protein
VLLAILFAATCAQRENQTARQSNSDKKNLKL